MTVMFSIVMNKDYCFVVLHKVRKVCCREMFFFSLNDTAHAQLLVKRSCFAATCFQQARHDVSYTNVVLPAPGYTVIKLAMLIFFLYSQLHNDRILKLFFLHNITTTCRLLCFNKVSALILCVKWWFSE